MEEILNKCEVEAGPRGAAGSVGCMSCRHKPLGCIPSTVQTRHGSARGLSYHLEVSAVQGHPHLYTKFEAEWDTRGFASDTHDMDRETDRKYCELE